MGERGMGRAGVLMVNTGSPAAPTAPAVAAYLKTFLMDERIRPLPAPVWRAILDHIILPRRSPASAAKYASIWTEAGSPLIVGCCALAARVEQALHAGAAATEPWRDAAVRAAMVYGEPGVEAALRELRAAGCERLAVLPLYPQSAYSTTAAALDAVARGLQRMGWEPPLTAVESYGDDAGYVDAVAASIRAAGFDAAGDYLLLSFHAVPLPDVDAGDTYPQQVGKTARAVAARLGLDEGAWSFSYQSPFEDGRRWTGPNTARTVRALARHEPRRLVVACPGFSVDCLETLYDVEQVMLPAYRAQRGGDAPGLVYVPCLNDAQDHARVLADIVCRALVGDGTVG